ncbi:manganese efflux pump MntP family protein [Desulfovibrio sp. OttesenSCG-928-M14]|nr:manganese efflux pump MntP family protein [Desulfovibrio sp. OttesenSCG-928-M14]MDL2291026.1 manganese efflux pump MntP family protein [Desulfovibrio sp. OttesenSCG-928-F20]
MNILTLLAIAAALAMDAFAVALATGLRLGCVSAGQVLRMAGLFGLFQAAMPLLGWLLGTGAQRFIEAYDHWLAFALLVFVGGRMIREAWQTRHDGEDCQSPDPTRGSALWLLALATSIDALAVGLSLALLGTGIVFPALVIGLVCFCLTALGMHLGCLACSLPGLGKLGAKANALGGLALLCVGVKILHEHGVFS